jgi:hypothetical protein
MVVDPFEGRGLADVEVIGSPANSEGGHHAGVIGCLETGFQQPVEVGGRAFRSRLMSENRRSEHCVIDPAGGRG